MSILENMKNYKKEMIELRRDFHTHPEIGFDLERTSTVVEQKLREYGYEVITGIAKTGVVGILKSNKPGKTIAIRADMDALAMKDEVETEYKSINKGFAHACGHDAHTAMLLGAARYIADHRDEFSGTIKLLFQPSEEGDPEPGAPHVIASGILNDCDAIFGLHVDPSYECGQVGIRYGSLYSGATLFDIEINGLGGHGAYPEISKDPVIVASQIINNSQVIISRNTSPMENAVLSFCFMQAGDARNVIPERAYLGGTTRALNQELLLANMERLEKIVSKTCDIHGCTYKINHRIMAPVLYNDLEMTKITEQAAVDIVGNDNVIIQDHAEMGAEDFAYYCEIAPCSYFILGVSNKERGITNYCHHPKFDIDEDSLVIGASIFASIVKKLL
ncbi:MAG: M20 family metallopeptidase [Acidaminococcaceae bacterium]|nr:M20 family metallopeptidase [Acidaminococcaceae bacterium]